MRFARPVAMLAGLTALFLLIALDAFGPPSIQAQEPASPPPADARLEAQALQLERQLLCPQCTSKRLDVCDLPICEDMRRLIREQLAAGRLPEDILLYFRGRYGQRVLAEIPKEGFNLFLFGWVGGSIAGVALVGGIFLYRLRRASGRRPTWASSGDDEEWLDAMRGEGP